MKKIEKLTQLRHLKDGKIFKVFSKNWSMTDIGTLFIKENGVEVEIPRNKCTHSSNIDKNTKKIKSITKENSSDSIVYGINDFGYSNEYWE